MIGEGKGGFREAFGRWRREEAEEEAESIRAEMQSPDVVSDAMRLHACYERLQTVEAEVAALYARWAELEAKQA